MAANRERGEVEIIIGGRARILRWGFNASAILEGLYGGKPLHEIFVEGKPIGFETIRSVLYAGIRWPEGTTINDVGDLLEVKDLATYVGKINEAIELYAASLDPQKASAITQPGA